MSITYRYLLLLLVSCAAVITAYFLQPFSQAIEYHEFIDTRQHYGLVNFWNVVSNAGFLIFGALGFISAVQAGRKQHNFILQHSYTLFFTASILLAFASAFYHLQPSNDSLVWDRLAMSLAFMALFTIILSEHFSKQSGALLLLPLLILGAWSVLYWYKTEQMQIGDLRPYLLVQFLPVILITLILVLFKTPGHNRIYIWMMLLFYGLSKAAEYYDQALYDLTESMISGHSIKHILASLSILFVYFHMLTKPEITAEIATDIEHDDA